MTNEIATRDVDSWAPMLPAVGDLANKIAGTNFVPKSLRGKPAETAACILAGREIGIGPMESLQKIHVIEGRPSLASELMRSLVLRAGHLIEFTTLTDAKVTIRGKRQGSETWTELTWTVADAQRIGVAGKDVWKKYPRAMLSNRATSELCRLIFPDALGGISYTPEEIEDEATEAKTIKIERADVKPTKVQRAKAPEPIEPAFDDVVDAEIVEAEIVVEAAAAEEAKPESPMITTAQTKMLGALMNELHIIDRTQALIYCNSVIGREITSRNELTKTEASAVIESLNADKASQGDPTFPHGPTLDGE